MDDNSTSNMGTTYKFCVIERLDDNTLNNLINKNNLILILS